VRLRKISRHRFLFGREFKPSGHGHSGPLRGFDVTLKFVPRQLHFLRRLGELNNVSIAHWRRPNLIGKERSMSKVKLQAERSPAARCARSRSQYPAILKKLFTGQGETIHRSCNDIESSDGTVSLELINSNIFSVGVLNRSPKFQTF
jgi:hypothetical protein